MLNKKCVAYIFVSLFVFPAMCMEEVQKALKDFSEDQKAIVLQVTKKRMFEDYERRCLVVKVLQEQGIPRELRYGIERDFSADSIKRSQDFCLTTGLPTSMIPAFFIMNNKIWQPFLDNSAEEILFVHGIIQGPTPFDSFVIDAQIGVINESRQLFEELERSNRRKQKALDNLRSSLEQPKRNESSHRNSHCDRKKLIELTE